MLIQPQSAMPPQQPPASEGRRTIGRARLPQSAAKRGFILILVLGFVVLLAWLSTVVTTELRRQIQLQGLRVERTQLRPAAYQTLELVIAAFAEIKELDKGFYNPVQGWGDPLSYMQIDESFILPPEAVAPIEGFRIEQEQEEEEDPFATAARDAQTAIDANRSDLAKRASLDVEPLQLTLSDPIIDPQFPPPVRVRVEIEDESGKVALNHASEQRLIYLFEAMGFDTSEAQTLAHSLLDWIDRDENTRAYGAESNFYRQMRPPYSAANRPISNLRELRLVNGFNKLFFDEGGKPNEVFAELSRAVSVYNTDNKINLNTAPDTVLRMLEEEIELVPENITRYLSGNDMLPGTADDRVLRPDLESDDLPRGSGEANPLDFSVQARFVQVTIHAGAGNSIFTLRALLDLSKPHKGGLYPFTIVQIVENGELH